MKCPNCGADILEGKRFCGDCGAIISLPSPATKSERAAGMSRRRSRAIKLTVIALGAAVIVISAAFLASMYLIPPPSPTEVLREWVDCMNSGNARGAADLTIYSKYDSTSYQAQVAYLEAILRDMGTDKLILNFAEVIPRDEVYLEDWYSGLSSLKVLLLSQYDMTIEDTLGVYCSITFYKDGQAEVAIDSWPVFKVDSSWYLAYGL